MWFKSYLLQFAVLLLMVTLISAASANFPTKVRQKRTIQYFFDGLLSILTKQNPFSSNSKTAAKYQTNARATSEQSFSPILTLAKLSSFSTQPRVFDLDDDDEDKSDDDVKKPTFLIQFPIPTLGPSTASSMKTQTQLTKPSMTKRMENEDENKNSTRMKSDSEHISDNSNQVIKNSTFGKIDMEILTTTADAITSNITNSMESIESVNTTKLTESTEVTEMTTIEPEMSTEATELTTLDPDLDDVTNSSSSPNSMERRIDLGKVPTKASDLHTTQFFGGPLVIERHRDADHIPIYTDNCIDVKCRENESNEILPYLKPESRGIPLISMTVALPISNRDQRSKDGQYYNVFTIHSIPIFHSFDSRPLSNKIRDIPNTQ